MKQPKKIFTRMLINNWGGISHKMLEFHEYVNLFSGKSGSGKSTVMDAIQVVLYGSVSANFLNKAADDSKNKRSVLSYLRGAQKDGTANRGDVDFCSQIVLEIEDTATHIVTCVGAAFEVAKGDTDLKKYTYFSHSGRIPKDEYLENNVPYSIAQIRKLTEERSRSADNRGRGEVNKVYPSKEAYLYTLYGEIFGQVEQGRMITMEKSAIALKMTSGTGQFIRDYMLNNISVKGEVSNCKYHSSGHIYFTIKDRASQLSCVMFASMRKHLLFTLEEGQSIVVDGNIGVYERDGKYQLYARSITKEGAGKLYEEYEKLKKRLLAEGLFDDTRKRKIPSYAKKIGVVTAGTGAVIQDICNVSKRRNPYVQIILYPAKVQGTGAADTIIKGIRYFEKTDVDTIIIGRGGGSIEDLWAFNEPEVVEAVFNASTPVISAVGHETDFTLTDFVADMRAPTPSAAAELAVTEVAAVENRIYEYERRLKQQMMYSLSAKRDYLERLKLQMEYLNPVNQIYDKRQRLMNMEDKLNMLIKRCAAENRNRLRLYASKLEGLSPLRKLDMGYGYIENSEGNRIVSARQVSEDDEITVYLKDGSIRSKVIEVGEAWQKH